MLHEVPPRPSCSMFSPCVQCGDTGHWMFLFCSVGFIFHTCLSQLATDTEGSKRTEKEETVNTVSMPVRGQSWHGNNGEVMPWMRLEQQQGGAWAPAAGWVVIHLCCPFHQVPRCESTQGKLLRVEKFCFRLDWKTEMTCISETVGKEGNEGWSDHSERIRMWKKDKEFLQQTFDCDSKIKAVTPSE